MANGFPTQLSLYLCLCALASSTGLANDWPEPFRRDANLNHVHFVDQNVGWAVGDRGAVWHTQDGGQAWELRSCSQSKRLTAVTFLDAERGWLAGGAVEPYSMDGAGFILTTEDAGQTWQPMKRAALSYVHDLSLHDDRHAVVVGSRWPLFPSGVFHTRDGGRGWHPLPVPTDEDWIACETNLSGELLLIGRHQAIGQLSPQSPRQGVGTADLQHHLRCGCWLDNGLAMVAGDEGTLLALVDDRWLDASAALPGSKARFDFQTITAVGKRIWLAGAPGNIVWRSDNAGRTWSAMPTGQALPIHDLYFVDAEHGWAVGALGLILATSDGGQSWEVQHGEQRRIGALVVSGSSQQFPWTVMAHLSSEHPVRSHAIVVAGATDTAVPQSYVVDPAIRLSEAALSLGASGADRWTEFPVADNIVQPNRHAIEAGWALYQRPLDLSQSGTNRLTQRLTTAIRQWRPDLIVLNSDEKQPHLNRLLVEATIAAKTAAAQPDTQDGPPGLLPPWQVRHIITATTSAPTGASTSARLLPSRLSLPLGSSIGELATNAAALLEPPPHAAAPVYLKSVMGAPARGDLGVLFAAKTAAKRAASTRPLTGSIDGLAKQAQQRENTRALLERANSDHDAARSLQLIAQLPAASAARLMLNVANRFLAHGDTNNGKQTLSALRQQYPQHPAAKEALRQLFTLACSEEAQVRNRRGESFEINNTNSLSNEPVIQATHVVENLTNRTAEQWHSEFPSDQRGRPEFQFALASTRPADQSASLLNRLKQSAPTQPLRLSAAAEVWLQDSSRKSPKPIWNCRLGSRPTIDGMLDEPLWSDSVSQSLGKLKQLEHPLQTQLWIARDDRFLYLAAKCQRLSEINYPDPTRQDRPRDTMPGDLDRVDFYFDVNRDYSTGWRLGFDSRGWAIDSESGDVAWNPTWFVAASLNEQFWTVEAAIPLQELVLNATKLKTAWLGGAVRTVPGWGWQAWPPTSSAEPDWHELGLLMLNPFGERAAAAH